MAVGSLGSVVAITARAQHACALAANDQVHCWGHNNAGQLGDGSLVDRSMPVAVAGSAGSISARAVATQVDHACAIRADGGVACWGVNSQGQLGDGTTTSRLTPAAVSGLTSAVAVTIGGAHTCALRADGTVRCWGRNADGQLGDGTTTTRLTPVAVSGLSTVVAVAAGRDHSCAVLANGTLRCWGRNDSGQLGDGTTTMRPAHVGVGVLSGAIAVAAGGSHTCAVLATGLVFCWGRNAQGQLADGTTTNRLTPVFSGPATAVGVAAGREHTCALLAAGVVRCWGDNAHGQLGDGTVSDRTTPVSVAGLTTPTSVSGSEGHTCATLADGRARCWGDNNRGQLGDGTTTDRLVPEPVDTLVVLSKLAGSTQQPLAGVRGITAATSHSCALTAGGLVYCWGSNLSGQLGNGTATESLVATLVPSFAFNVDPVVPLAASRRVATVTALVNCPEGQQVQVRASVTQGEVFGQGLTVGTCTGGLEGYEVTVPAEGRRRFVAGPAEAEADAIVRERGVVVDAQEWTREVELMLAP